MNNVHSILESIRNTPGTNDKISMLTAHNNDADLKNVVLYALDPRRNFNIRKIPAYISPAVGTSTLTDAFALLDQFVKREITGNAAIDALRHMLSTLSLEDAKVLELIIDKSLDCGIQDKTANKVYGKNFIQETPYMRCDLTSQKTLAKLRWSCPDGTPGVYGEIKADGQYLNHLVVNGFYNAESRNGKSYDFMGAPDNDFLELASILQEKFGHKYNLQNIVFNGEGVVEEDGIILPRTTGNGIVQKFGKNSGSILEVDNIRFILWDFLPHESYNNGEWNVPRKERRTMLDEAIRELSSRHASVIRMVEFRPLKNFAEAFAWNIEVMGRGEEGIIIKDERGTWKFHTSPYQLKLKLVFDVDLVVVDKEEGSGKNKGSLGALICETSDGLLRVGVGTGWLEKINPKDPDSEIYTRQWVWDNFEECVKGRILMTTANDIIRDKNNPEIWSLFLPRVGEWRTDKNTADTLQRCFEIKEMVIAAGGQMGTDAL